MVVRRRPRRQRLQRRRVEQVEVDLHGLDSALAHHPPHRLAVAQPRDSDEPRQPLIPQRAQRLQRPARAERVLDRDRAAPLPAFGRDRVVQLDQLDPLALQPLQTRRQRTLRRARNVAQLVFAQPHLGRDHGAIPFRAEQVADPRLRQPVQVARRRINEIDPLFQRQLNRRPRVLLRCAPQPVAAQADLRHHQPRSPQAPVSHRCPTFPPT